MSDVGWVEYRERRPNKYGLYKIKTIGLPSHVKQAYYNPENDCWIHDDGVWLPFDIRLYVTHWKD